MLSLFQPFPTTRIGGPNSGGGDFASLFRQILDDYDVHRSSQDSEPPLAPLSANVPRFDVRETKDSYNLDGEIPGALQKDVEIEFADPQTLVIKGSSEREYRTPNETNTGKEETGSGDEHDGNQPRYWVSERSTGEFQRVFKFQDRVDQDGVKASLKNGILSVAVPKQPAPSPKKVAVE